MYDERLETLVLDAPSIHLERHTADRAPAAYAFEACRPTDRSGLHDDRRREADDLAAMKGIFVAVVLSAIFSLIVGWIVLLTLMGGLP